DPGDGALQAEAEARVRHRAVAPQVEVPVEGRLGEPVRLDLSPEEVDVGGAFAAADDFAVAFGREHIHAEGEAVVVGVALHVTRLDGGRVAVDDDRAVVVPRQDGLVGAAEVAAPLEVFRGFAPLRDVAQGLFDLGQPLVDLDLARVDLPFARLFGL